MGTRLLPSQEWLLRDHLAEAEIILRRRLLAEQRDHVFACTPRAEGPAEEAARMVEGWVAAQPRLSLAESVETHPLARAGSLIQEDLCLMVHHGEAWRLEGAVLCFPSLWVLAEKLGQPAALIHEPVPYYAAELSSRVDRFLDRLSADKPVWRRNFSLWPDLLLWAPIHAFSPTLASPPSDVRALWLRSERQTLRRLPDTGGILFTIRVQMTPLTSFSERPDRARDLATWLRAPTGQTRRDQIGPIIDDALEWLDGAAQRAGEPTDS